jgi:hypothetical protein
MELPIEKQLRLENIRRGLKELSREELEEMLMQTTEALVKLTTQVQLFCTEHGLLRSEEVL